MQIKRYSLLLSFLMLSGLLLAQKAHRKLIFFQTEKSALTDQSVKSLQSLFTNSPDGTQFQFEMMGLIDKEDNIAIINQLMSDRADHLLSFFTERGMNPALVNFEATPLNPLLLDNTARRDSVTSWLVNVNIIRPPLAEKPLVVATPVAKVFPKKPKVVRANPRQKLKIEGRKGTRITAPKHTFVFADGTLAIEEVQIKVEEYYSIADYLMADLSTTCNGTMIESGGMIHISAACQGREVFIAEGKSMKIALPVEQTGSKKKNGMETFIGVETGQGLDWKLASELLNKRGRGQRKNKKYYEGMLANDTDTSLTTLLNDSAAFVDNNMMYNNWNARNINQNYYPSNQQINLRSSAGDKYLLETTEMGWINCDRFYDVEEKAPLFVKVDTAYHPSVRLVFKDINSVTSAYYNSQNEQYEFSGLPVGQTATLIAYSIVEGKAYFEAREVRISKSGLENMSMTEMSEADLKRNFTRLNRS